MDNQSGDMMGFRKDLTGKVFGKLTVLGFSHNDKKNGSIWKCKCECGGTKNTPFSSLSSGRVISCGCLRYKAVGNRKDLAGKQFGRWSVIKFKHIGEHRQTCWECKCSCGTIKILSAQLLTRGGSKSCGCLKNEITKLAKTTHDLSKTPEYKVWIGMKGRCNNPNNQAAKYYSLRKIKICSRWNEFVNFYQDMGKRPSDKHTIERTDNDGNYEPSNCIWATRLVQANNKRDTIFLTHNNKKQTISQWAKELGINHETIRSRLNRGWNDEDTLTIPS